MASWYFVHLFSVISSPIVQSPVHTHALKRRLVAAKVVPQKRVHRIVFYKPIHILRHCKVLSLDYYWNGWPPRLRELPRDDTFNLGLPKLTIIGSMSMWASSVWFRTYSIYTTGAKAVMSLIFELYSGLSEVITKKTDVPWECPTKWSFSDFVFWRT